METSLRVTFTRCLVGFSFPVRSKLNVHFTPQTDNDKPGNEVELTELDFEQEVYEEDRINLSSPVRDLILLSLPQISSQCGINLNEKHCDCNKEEPCDPRLAVLQELKDKLK